MQCKDIPDKPILEFLANKPYKVHGYEWSTWFIGWENSINQAMPGVTNEKLIQAKMINLVNRGLVDGCICGCRGDYKITDKGRDFLDSK
jgi:hypothetical protein